MDFGNVLASIDYETIIPGLVTGFMIIYSEKLKQKSYVIDKEMIFRNSIKDKSMLKINVREKYEPKIIEFIDTLRRELPDISFPYLNQNYSDLIICETKCKRNTTGNYNGGLNLIKLLKNDNKGSLSHELFHASSSFNNGYYRYCGFSQENKKNIELIGDGLNEGYTSLLDERYFPREDGTVSYDILNLICKALEQIIGSKNMTQMYFNADLNGFIKALSKYTSEEIVYRFIKMLDSIKIECYSEVKPLATRINDINECYRFILHCYLKFIINSYQEGLITKTEIIPLIDKFVRMIHFEFLNDGKICVTIPLEDVNELVKECFDTSEDMFTVPKTNNKK